VTGVLARPPQNQRRKCGAGRPFFEDALRLAIPESRTTPSSRAYNIGMYHYNPTTALEELTEDAVLPNPVHVRDMMLRHKLTADQSLELNRIFLEYQKFFGEAQKLGKDILKRLSA
jgi:hypothetical protein